MVLLHLIGLLLWLINVKYKSMLDCFGTMKTFLIKNRRNILFPYGIHLKYVSGHELPVDDIGPIMVKNHLNLLFMYFSTHSGPESCY